jgi:uncharacterized protein YkwD
MLLVPSCSRGLEISESRSATGSETVTVDSVDPGDLSAQMMNTAESIQQAVNVKRAEAGAPSLISHPALVDLASERSTALAVDSYLAHEDPASGTVAVESALAEMNYSGPATELLFAAQDPLESVADRVIEAWFTDPMHKALLLEPSFRYCGIGLMGDGELWKISMILTTGLPPEVGS